MKKIALVVAIVIFCQLAVCAQTAPNFENGWKPYGSYDGSHMDTVNLMNGNLMLHAPLVPDIPQRGALSLNYSLYVSSKDWQTVCIPNSQSGNGEVCRWQKGGTGIAIHRPTEISVNRTLVKTGSGTGTVISGTQGYSVSTADGATHKLHGVAGTEDANGEATKFDSADLTGYHLEMSGVDANGVLSTFALIDRSGTVYQGTFPLANKACNHVQGNAIPAPGGHAPLIDDAPFGDQVCPQTARAILATDPNGNQMGISGQGTSSSNIAPDFPSSVLDTLGRLIGASAAGPDPGPCVSIHPIVATYSFNYNAPDGTVRQAKFCSAEILIQTAFNAFAGSSGIAEAVTGGATGLHLYPVVSIVLADGTHWTFDYDSYGELTYIGLPTGGSITYTWTTVSFANCDLSSRTPVSRAVASRTVSDALGNTANWAYHWGTSSQSGIVNVVTDPANNDTVHTFTSQGPGGNTGTGCNLFETSTTEFQGPQGANNPLRKVDTSFSSSVITIDDAALGTPGVGNVFATDITTTVYPSGKVKKVHRDPDPGLGAGSPSFGNVVRELEYDWGQGTPGALLRETDTVYKWQKDSSYLAAHLIDLPASKVIISPVAAANIKSGCPVTPGTTANCMSETDYTYDEAIYLTTPTPAITTQHVASPFGIRGNLTTASSWLNTTNSFIASHTNWYDTGEPYKKIDALGHTTTLSYDPAYAGGYVTQTCSPATGTVTHCVSGTYDFTTGVLSSLTDQNGQTSNYGYDFMFHIASAQAPPDAANGNLRATNTFSYSDITSPGVFPLSMTRVKSVTSTLSDSVTANFDGLGRAVTSAHAMPSGPPATVTTNFDDLHAKVIVSNPYFTTADSTYGTNTTQSDALGRASTVTEQDGSVKTMAYDVVAPAGTLGNCNVSVDEVGNQRQSCSDALGRLVEVDEPGAPFAGTPSSGTINFGGALKSVSGIGAHGAFQASSVLTLNGLNHITTIIPRCPPRQNCDQTPVTTLDSGVVTISLNGRPYSYAFGQGVSGDSAFSVAIALAGSIHLADPQVDAVASNTGASSATITLTARTGGSAGNSIAFTTTWTWDTLDFPTAGPSFSFAAPTSGSLANGFDGFGGTTVWDGGTVSLAVGGYSAQVCYGVSGQCATIPPASGCVAGNTDATQVACLLAYTIRSLSPPFTIAASGGLISINWSSNTAAGNVAVTATSSTVQTAYFSTPSFVGCGGSCSAATANPQTYTTATSGGESPTGPGVAHNYYATLYQYDTLGNLLCVEQHGNVTGTGCASPASADATSPWRVRRFTYDSLSRLLTVHNPESGTISYTYDADGNLLQKTSPAPNQTGTATQTISFCYDELHRVTGKAYSAQSCPLASPVVTYTYDAGTNAKGKLTSLTDQAGSASYSYDTLGRMIGETRVINGVSKSMSYDYNLDGSLKTIHYPSGAVVTYTPDSAGRTLSAIDTVNNLNYVTGTSYQADGQLLGFVSGNSAGFTGITNAFSYNKRLQPINMSAASPSQTVYSIGYDFHVGNGSTGADNGNVWGITNYKDNTRNQSFTYDVLNRLTSAQNAGTANPPPASDCNVLVLQNKTKYWGNSYTYDAWGNLTNKTITKCGAENLSAPALVNNQLTGYGYDAAGNMTTDPTDGVSLTYDPENRITGASGYTYTYDADGNRVKKTNGTTGTLYWYMTPGIVGESDLSGVLKSEYVFFDGERVARRDLPSGTVAYYFSDHLKTASVITDGAGNIKSESDYYPWGGELQFLANDSNHYKFTGKERDETGLDYFGARYYSNGLARFITPDWAAKATAVPYAEFADPQSLNLYTYVRNVPTSSADIDGHCPDLCIAETLIVTAVVSSFVATPTGQQAVKAGVQIGDKITSWLAEKGTQLSEGLAAEGMHPQILPVGGTMMSRAFNSDQQAKQSPNPHGSPGAPDHQKKVNELVEKAKGEAKEGETVESNKKVKGLDSERRPDVQIIDAEKKTRKAFEAERHPNRDRNKKREAEYKKLKLDNETHPLK